MVGTRKRIAAVVAGLCLFAAGPVYAQSSVEGYVAPGGTVEEDLGGVGPGGGGGGPAGGRDNVPAGELAQKAPAEGAGGKRLPFTGLDLALLAVAGGALALLGVGMRRLTRAPESA
jgi:hypothetical protein